MKKFFLFLALVVVFVAAVCFGADAVVPAAAAVPAVGFMDWFKQNATAVIGAALALSEVLSLIPAFQGNGILDTIIKALKVMSEKPAA